MYFLLFFTMTQTHALECKYLNENEVECEGKTYIHDLIVGQKTMACEPEVAVEEQIQIALLIANRDVSTDPMTCYLYEQDTILCDDGIYFPDDHDVVTNPCNIVLNDGRTLEDLTADLQVEHALENIIISQ